MKDITTISKEELNKDLIESKQDVVICERAISMGIYHYSGGLVKSRLDINKKIIVTIENEIKRREVAIDV